MIEFKKEEVAYFLMNMSALLSLGFFQIEIQKTEFANLICFIQPVIWIMTSLSLYIVFCEKKQMIELIRVSLLHAATFVVILHFLFWQQLKGYIIIRSILLLIYIVSFIFEKTQ